mgnify:CR=1 FL=1
MFLRSQGYRVLRFWAPDVLREQPAVSNAIRRLRDAAYLSQQELALRILCSEADISFGRLRSNRVSQKEWTRIIQTVRNVLVERGYGRANLEYDVPITPATVFEAGSVSKQFTAAAVILERWFEQH